MPIVKLLFHFEQYKCIRAYYETFYFIVIKKSYCICYYFCFCYIIMLMAEIRFYEELNDFLRKDLKKIPYQVNTSKGQSVKDLIESQNVPHTEVDLILVNGESVDFSYQVKENDRISVYPVFESFNIQDKTCIRGKPLRITKFILDVHLGKLARYLRFSGFDCLYSNKFEDSEIAEISDKEGRIVLTRDKGLLKRSIIKKAAG